MKTRVNKVIAVVESWTECHPYIMGLIIGILGTIAFVNVIEYFSTLIH